MCPNKPRRRQEMMSTMESYWLIAAFVTWSCHFIWGMRRWQLWWKASSILRSLLVVSTSTHHTEATIQVMTHVLYMDSFVSNWIYWNCRQRFFNDRMVAKASSILRMISAILLTAIRMLDATEISDLRVPHWPLTCLGWIKIRAFGALNTVAYRLSRFQPITLYPQAVQHKTWLWWSLFAMQMMQTCRQNTVYSDRQTNMTYDNKKPSCR